jgi:hypothetical protein
MRNLIIKDGQIVKCGMSFNLFMKVILPVYEIPIGSTVTKITGDKEYIIKDKIIVYGDPNLTKELKSDDSTRFLVSKNGDLNISVISWDKEMLWNVSDEELYRYLYDKTQLDNK